MSNDNDSNAQACIKAGVEGAQANGRMMWLGREGCAAIPIAIIPSGFDVEVLSEVMSESEDKANAPMAIQGLSTHQEPVSFCAHVNLFKDAQTALWADPNHSTVAAIYDYHGPKEPRWGDHRAVYSCPLSPEWKEWVYAAARSYTQSEFADFIDEHRADLAGPQDGVGAKAIELIEMARNLRIHTKGTFERQINEVSGEFSLVSKEEHAASSTKIPANWFVGLRVYQGGTAYPVECRMRFRVRQGSPTFSFKLYRHEEIGRQAFEDVISYVAKQTEIAPYVGTAESYR